VVVLAVEKLAAEAALVGLELERHFPLLLELHIL
jgi:hypothetical protein